MLCRAPYRSASLHTADTTCPYLRTFRHRKHAVLTHVEKVPKIHDKSLSMLLRHPPSDGAHFSRQFLRLYQRTTWLGVCRLTSRMITIRRELAGTVWRPTCRTSPISQKPPNTSRLAYVETCLTFSWALVWHMHVQGVFAHISAHPGPSCHTSLDASWHPSESGVLRKHESEMFHNVPKTLRISSSLSNVVQDIAPASGLKASLPRMLVWLVMQAKEAAAQFEADASRKETRKQARRPSCWKSVFAGLCRIQTRQVKMTLRRNITAVSAVWAAIKARRVALEHVLVVVSVRPQTRPKGTYIHRYTDALLRYADTPTGRSHRYTHTPRGARVGNGISAYPRKRGGLGGRESV